MSEAFFYYSKLNKSLSAQEISKEILKFRNKNIQKSILKYKELKDKTLSLHCKILLKHILKDLNREDILQTFYIDEFKKPRLNKGFISFSHSVEYSGAVYCEDSAVGVDIERLKFDNIDEPFHFLRDKLNFNWGKEYFYSYWCRLESLLKAYGSGFLKDISGVVIEKDFGIIYGKKYYFYEYKLDNDYIAVLAVENFNLLKKLKYCQLS